MKTVLKSLLILALLVFPGCEKLTDNPDVDDFINQLISGNYESYELPEFNRNDIPALLKYRNENTIIKNFPRNPISSYWQAECKLGIYALWTIESIRATETNSDNLIGRFPSQNPVLAFRDTTKLQLVFDDQSHKEAARAYNDWWNSFYIFQDKMKVDPLKTTKYRWH